VGLCRTYWWRILYVIPIFPRVRQLSCIMIIKCIIFVVINAVKCFLSKKEPKNEIFY
jgi:hypothetical protein